MLSPRKKLVLAFAAGLVTGAFGMMFLGAVLVFLENIEAQQKSGRSNTALNDRRAAEKIYAAAGDEALAEARKFVVGTWTFTGRETGPTMWIKWEAKSDGTMLEYNAMATEDDWGTPDTEKWEIVTKKYSNTGNRYYAFSIFGGAEAVIRRDGKLECKVPDYMFVMERGDKFPFSK